MGGSTCSFSQVPWLFQPQSRRHILFNNVVELVEPPLEYVNMSTSSGSCIAAGFG